MSAINRRAGQPMSFRKTVGVHSDAQLAGIRLSSSPIHHILERLEGVRRSGAGWIAKCPGHEDVHASLSVACGEDGRVLLCCHAGCQTARILECLGMKVADLFPARRQEGQKLSSHIRATYNYVDENGELLFQTVRFFPKDFRQRRPDGKGRWIWNLRGLNLAVVNS